MKLSCYIVDDEPLAIEVLQSHIENMGGIEIKGTFQNPLQAFQALHQESVDLLLLDIQMPGLTGLELLRSLSHPPSVILTTAYREYALTGFELDVVDYLLKPVSFERFLQAIGKVYKYRTIATRLENGTDDEAVFYVQGGGKTSRLLLDDILYLESQRDYVKIMTTSGELRLQAKISAFEEKLHKKGFMRIHRSFIAPLTKIEWWSACELGIREHVLPIGRTYSKEVLQVLMARMKKA